MERYEPQSMIELLGVVMGHNEDWVEELRQFHALTHAQFNAWWNANAIIEAAQESARIDPCRRNAA